MQRKRIHSIQTKHCWEDFLNQRHMSLASDVIAIIDPVNPKQVKIFDINSCKAGQVFGQMRISLQFINDFSIPFFIFGIVNQSTFFLFIIKYSRTPI